ncbi:MAG TPA: agmatine deiminase family protein [Polyangiaceae bacterium]|nr:agmatine deiminase family protein [Polyangiaceae bacterium]
MARRSSLGSSLAGTPRQLGYRMPAEWEPHAATWLAWPHNGDDWPGKLQAVSWVFTEIIRQLTVGERVNLIIPQHKHEKAIAAQLDRARIDTKQVSFFAAKTDRSWTRDYLPQFVIKGKGGKGALGAVKFRFNGWARYPDHKLDDLAGGMVADGASQRWLPTVVGRRVVLEGGSIDVDGQGTLLTTERCLLGKPYQRNPGLNRNKIEQLLTEYLGAQHTIWLPDGIAGDDTSGHIDDLARFVAPGKVVVIAEKNKRDANYKVLANCKARLQAARDAQGRKLEVIGLPMPAPLYFGADRLPASYANFYIGNETVLVPTFNDPADRVALGILAELFPKRRVVGIHAVELVLGLGTIHCSTQQQPL